VEGKSVETGLSRAETNNTGREIGYVFFVLFVGILLLLPYLCVVCFARFVTKPVPSDNDFCVTRCWYCSVGKNRIMNKDCLREIRTDRRFETEEKMVKTPLVSRPNI
jgi:hypothetical protein